MQNEDNNSTYEIKRADRVAGAQEAASACLLVVMPVTNGSPLFLAAEESSFSPSGESQAGLR